MTELFIATLGPVQPFIASARRTKDLYVGSTLLSELSREAAHAVAKHEGLTSLIFPAPTSMQELEPDASSTTAPLNVANKIVAVINHSPAQMGHVVYVAVQKRLREVKEAAFKSIRGDFDWETANKQIDDLVEFAWVAVPFDGTNYRQARDAAEGVLGARKNTNFFTKVGWYREDVKSSIDGRIECVIPATNYPSRRADEALMRKKAFYLFRNYGVGPDERLSGVDLLKRNAANTLNPPTILSTSHVATLPYLQALDERLDEGAKIEAKELWGNYIETVKALVTPEGDDPDQGQPASSILELVPDKYRKHSILQCYDGGLLFEERLFEDTVYKQKFPIAQKALEKFFCFTDERLDHARPDPYYAILVADGDNMGKAIDALAIQGYRRHRDFSQALAAFAAQARQIIEEHDGVAVYAGGDDVVALLPLHKALACASKLSTTFAEDMACALGEAGAEKNVRPPTLSAGLAVVHHLSLLQDALEVARSAERKAKGQREKNALAIIVKKRSGEDYAIVVPWKDVGDRLQRLIDLYSDGILPGRAAYELRAMQQRLQPIGNASEDGENAVFNKKKIGRAIQVDAARILRRKLCLPQSKLQQNAREREKEIVAMLLGYVGVRRDVDGTLTVIEPTETQDIAPFINELMVAQVFADALRPLSGVKLAGPTKGDGA